MKEEKFLYFVLLRWRGLHKQYGVYAPDSVVASNLAVSRFMKEMGGASAPGEIFVDSIILKK